MPNNHTNRDMTRRRFLRLAGGGAAVSALLAACGGAPATSTPSGGAATSAAAASGKPFAGKEMTLFSAQHHTAYVKDSYVPLFEEKTGAKVNWIEVGGGDVEAKYAVFVASEDASADVLITWEAMNAKYARTLMEDITSTVNPQLLASLTEPSRKALNFLDKQYGVPIDSNMAIFMWNQDLYKAAGLDPAKPPESFAQFLDYSKKLTTGGKYATMFTMGDGNSGFVSFISIYNSTGGRLLSEDLTKLQVDTEEGLAAMNAINDLFVVEEVADPSGVTVASSIEQGKIFRAGNMGHYFAFPNHFTLAQAPDQSQVVGKVSHGIIPGLKLRSGSLNAIEGYAINRFAKNKELGMAWLEHIATPEVQKQVAIKWGRPPALQAMFEDPEVTKASPQFATVKEQSTYPSPRYGSPFYTDLGNVFVQHMLDMINGKGSPKETVTKIQADGQKLIDDYWAKAK
jgi:multiple sugar transport system substrate-binding protein